MLYTLKLLLFASFFPIKIQKNEKLRRLRIFILTKLRNLRIKKFMDSKEVVRILEEAGFKKVRQRGSHIRFKHPDGRSVTVPHPRKDIPIKTLRSIEQQSNIKF